LINGQLRQNESVSNVSLKINEFHAGGGGFGRVLKGIEARLKIMRGINVRRPLIAAGIKVTGGFIAQQDFHKIQKALLSSGLGSSATITKSVP